MSFWSDPVGSVSGSLNDLGSSVGNLVSNPLGTISSTLGHWGDVAQSGDFQQNALAAAALYFGIPNYAGDSALASSTTAEAAGAADATSVAGTAGGGIAGAGADFGAGTYGAGEGVSSNFVGMGSTPAAGAGAGTAGGGGFFDSMTSKMGQMGMKDWLKAGASGMNIMSGLQNYQMNQQRMGQQNQYANQLQQLMSNPASITGTPGYQSGLDAVQRSMQAQGYQGSGNMAGALANYGGNFYQQQLQNLGQLSGAGQQINPYGGLAMMGMGMGGLASL